MRIELGCAHLRLKVKPRARHPPGNPSMVTNVKLVSIPFKDQDRALEFYTLKLGFKLLTDEPHMGDQRWIELKVPGSDTNVALFTSPGDEGRIGTFMNV